MVGDYRGSFSRRSSDDSDDVSSVEEETTSSSLYSSGKEYTPTPTEWTDEKHSMYLKSMEASFVDQLYSSLGALGANLSKDNVPDIGPSTRFGNVRKPSEEQFKVLRDGFWQKMNVKQPEYRFNGRNGGGSHEFLRSPWIKHYKPSPKTQNPVSEPESQVVSSNGKKVISSSSSVSSFKQIIREGCSHSRDRDQISIGEEVSDQNFVNEVTKDENGSSKKMKTVMNNGSCSTDQNAELFTLTYGAIVRQLLTDLEDVEEVNKQLDQMGYNIGIRLIDEFLAKSGVSRCVDFKETAEMIAKVGFKMFLGVTASVTSWDADGTCCSIILEDNPLADFVELPDTCQGLYYCNVLSRVIRGALEMVSMKTEVTWTRDVLRGDDAYELQVKLLKQVAEEYPYKDDE